MKKILFVVDERRMGGVSILLEDIINKINRKQMNIDVLVLHNNGEMLDKFDNDVKVIYGTPYFESVDYSLKELIKGFKVKLLFKKIRLIIDMKTGNVKKKIVKERKKMLENKYDVEIAFKDGFTALFTAYGDSTKKIHWLHYEYEKLNPNGNYPKMFNDALSKFNLIVAVSKGVMDYFNKIYHLENKTMVISNIVNSEKIIAKGNVKIKENEKNDHNKINFISVGRLHPQKGYDQLIDALNILNQNNMLSNCLIKIYGDGPEKERLQQKINQYELNDYIKLMGQTMNPFGYVKDSDVFILSSIYEPFGLVIIESMTLGVPVLATSNAATGELINDAVNGMIVSNDVDGLYNGMKKIIDNPKLIDNMKKELIEYKYPINEIIKQIEGVLEN